MGGPSCQWRGDQLGWCQEQASPKVPQVNEAHRPLFLLPLWCQGPTCRRRVVTVVKEWYEDGGGAVDVKAVGEMRRPVDLKEMKGDDGLKGFALFRQPRLSVVPVSEDVWERVCDLGGGYEGDGKDDHVQDQDDDDGAED
uniref:EVE domain-containing protein n=1 Tax=Fagus sylvatica TaxID=28930 RepID=A0A2N9J1R9_FAGSY